MTNEIALENNVRAQGEGIEALPYLTIKITGSNNAAPTLESSGTGFFYRLSVDGSSIPMIVTNKHVVANLDNLTFHFGLMDHTGHRILGPAELITLQTATYPIVRHPDPDVDLAAIPAQPLIDAIIARRKQPYFLHLSSANLPPEWMRKKLVASTQVLMVGFPNGLMDEANNLPLTRKGILATPYIADHNGKPNFVVDIAAFGGSSGSPVYAYYEGMVPHEDGIGIGGNAVYLIGVLHSGPMVSAIGDVISTPIPTSKQISHTSLMMHLGYCLRAELIEDLVPIVRPLLAAK